MRDNKRAGHSKKKEGFFPAASKSSIAPMVPTSRRSRDEDKSGCKATSLRTTPMGQRLLLCALAAALAAGTALAQGKLPATPGKPARAAAQPAAGIDLSGVDAIVAQSIEKDEIPGAVLVVGRRGRVIYRKAYGSRAPVPQREKMTAETIFDMASLTKVFATAPSVMLLVEQGRVRLNDPVARYIPEFGTRGKEQVTVRQLLTHMSGLRPIPAVAADAKGTDAGLGAIYDDTLVAAPGARFQYSDTGYIVLAELVHRVSGMPLNEFAQKNLYAPLGMKETRFLPPAKWKARIAPTEEIDLPAGEKAGSGKGHMLRG